jgi:hypothetical protein
MTAREVKARSTIALPEPTEPFAVMQPAESHRVSLPCGAQSVELDEGLFSVVEARLGTVARVIATPQLEHDPPTRAIARAHLVEAALERIGFVSGQRIEAKEALIVIEHHDRARLSAWTAPFGSGAWRAEVWLSIAARAGTELAAMLELSEHACLVSVEVWDASLTETR